MKVVFFVVKEAHQHKETSQTTHQYFVNVLANFITYYLLARDDHLHIVDYLLVS
jgi:hypothetical protein